MGQPILRTSAHTNDKRRLDDVLRIGWKVNEQLVPLIVVEDRLADPSEELMVTLPAEDLASHTAIIAQSGSGKSFFVGRLLEEIALSSRARCLIFDPNGDYHALMRVEDDSRLWARNYDRKKQRGFLTHDRVRGFGQLWRNVRIAIKSAIKERNDFQNLGARRNRRVVPHFDWQGLYSEQLAALLAPRTNVLLRRQVYQAHEFVKAAYADLRREKLTLKEKERVNLIDFCKLVLANGPFDDLPTKAKALAERLNKRWATSDGLNDGQQLYFTAAEDLKDEAVFETNLSKLGSDIQHERRADLDVVDLPSVRKSHLRDLVVSSLLEYEWLNAVNDWMKPPVGGRDRRTPRFIVIDEAHNLIPKETWEPGQDVIRDQIRRIAAEGRKFGVFLILISQRPDKLDPYILSECKNHVVMKLSSTAVALETMHLLGLDANLQPAIQRCVSFTTGRGLLTGEWVDKRDGKHQFFYAAARRTQEGARNLDSDYWGKPGGHLSRALKRKA